MTGCTVITRIVDAFSFSYPGKSLRHMQHSILALRPFIFYSCFTGTTRGNARQVYTIPSGTGGTMGGTS
ncbi:MAG: hypothetical protein HQ517_06715 [SAR324 cluster bacterium]|nr:hypothetical protein [SAR324 cluster bacterium]